MSTPKDHIFQREAHVSRSKGRPRGRFFYFNDLKTIIKIAEQHKIPPQLLAKSLKEAWQHRTSTCGSLTIRRRGQTRNTVILLISNKEQIVIQFSLSVDVLRNTEYYIR